MTRAKRDARYAVPCPSGWLSVSFAGRAGPRAHNQIHYRSHLAKEPGSDKIARWQRTEDGFTKVCKALHHQLRPMVP